MKSVQTMQKLGKYLLNIALLEKCFWSQLHMCKVIYENVKDRADQKDMDK